jgi:tetratricopeptide (TPR) repeat protein
MSKNVLTHSKKTNALALFRQQRLAEACALLEEVCRTDRTDAEAWTLLGAANGMLGRYADAERNLQQVLQLRPSAEAHYYLGNTLLAQNRLPEAEASFRAALRLQPRLAEAQCNLGDTLQQLGRYREAEDCYRSAIELRPELTGAYLNLGLALHRQRKLDEAVSLYRHALRLWPGLAEVHYHLGNALTELSRLEEAIASHREAIRARPDFAMAHNNLALALYRARRYDEALTHHREALRLAPGVAGMHTNLGTTLYAMGRMEEAEREFRQALERPGGGEKRPAGANAAREGTLEAWLNLGSIKARQERWDEAVDCYRQALRQQPDHPEVHASLAIALHNQNKFNEAIAAGRRALELKPDHAGACHTLGAVHADLDRFEEAIAYYREALRHDPGSAESYIGLGMALCAVGQAHEAIETGRKAIEVSPRSADIHYGHGALLARIGMTEQALAGYREALRLDPRHRHSHFALAAQLLAQGDFREAWRHYAERRPAHNRESLDALPHDLHGKRILLIRDQGFGDELFFLRFAPQLKARGAWLAYGPGAKLRPLVERLEFIDRVAAVDEALEGMYRKIAVGDLPLLLGMDDVAKIPPPLALPARSEHLATLRTRLAALGPPPYIGLTWRGGVRAKREALFKECPLDALAGVLRPLNATVLVLQRLPREDEIGRLNGSLGRPAHDLSVVNDDLEAMLALLDLLDDYVGVSNTNMHLRAGLGKTARVLMPYPPEWRWMAEGRESPWFRGFPIYRQDRDRSWDGALGQLQNDLLRDSPSA